MNTNQAQGQPRDLPRDLAEMDAAWLDQLAKAKAEGFAEKIEVSQIRNIYSNIVKIRTAYRRHDRTLDEVLRQLIFLRPKLAYAAGRKREVRPFSTFFLKAIEGVTNSKNRERALENFFSLAEAVVAYHKFHGARD